MNQKPYKMKGPTKHHKEHNGAKLLKNTRISTTRTTRDLKKHKGANLFINTRISTTREHKGPIYLT